ARPESVRYWRSLACRAFAGATGPQAGPVHLNLAFREPLVPVPDEQGFPYPLEGRPEERSWTRVARSLRPPSEADVDRLAGEIAGASRGLILAGDGQADASAVLELARAAEWPVLADPLSGARCGEFAVSTYEALLSVLPFVRSHRPEMVVRIGRVSPSRRMAEFLNHRVKQILLDVGGVDEGWSDPERGASWAVEADPSMVCQAVAKALLPRSDRAWLDSWLGSESRARNAIDALLDATDEPSEPRVARDLCRILPEGATLVVASSMPVRDVEWFMPPRSGLRVLGNRGASGIDGFVSTSLGVAMASPGPTFALAGDLSLLHDANGLLAARSERNAPVEAIIVVVNNNGGAIFSFLPEADFPENFERLFGTPHDLDLADVARLYKCGYQKVERMSRFAAALAAARRAGGVNILEVPTDRQANVAHHRMLWEAVAGALGH
ncbi:MAG: 2-succinyl-5-enolpyruvyl-6-hydroxy-3-cyclohexene-1-carboxylate synthase, partial [Acidimicrobiales bacterium]